MSSFQRLPTQCLLVLFLVLIAAASRKDDDDKDYVVEVLAVVDQPMLEQWIKAPGVGTKKKVLEEVKSLFYEVNVIYQSLRRYGLNVEIRLKDVLFVDEKVIPERVVDDGSVRLEDASKCFNDFLKRNNITKYDHAIYLMSQDLYGSSQRTTGSALPNAACRRLGTSRVEAHLNARTAVTVAHELGHSLGASHDDPTNPDCEGGYIMDASGPTGARNRWFFSPCTARRFQRTLKDKRCLLKTTSPPIVAKRMGALSGKTNFCKRYFGNRINPSFDEGDELCNTLACSTGKTYKLTNTPDGMKCGKNKKCFMGYCV